MKDAGSQFVTQAQKVWDMSPMSPVQLICREWVKELGLWWIGQRLVRISKMNKHETHVKINKMNVQGDRLWIKPMVLKVNTVLSITVIFFSLLFFFSLPFSWSPTYGRSFTLYSSFYTMLVIHLLII